MTLAVPRTASLRIAGAGGNQSVSFGALPASGSMIVVVITSWSGQGSFSGPVVDNQGNSYSLEASKTDNDRARIHVYAAYNIGSPSGTFTVTGESFASSTYGSIVITEVTGAETSAAFDVSATNGAASSSNPATCSSGTTGTTAQADEIAFAAMLIDGGTNGTGMALPSGYTNIFDEENGASYLPTRTDYKILSATGTQSASWGSSINPTGGTGRWSGLIATFKAAAGGGGSQALEGAATGGATASGAASIEKPIAGTAAGGAIASGTLAVSGDVELAGAAAGGASASADLSVVSRSFEFTLYAVDGSTPLASKSWLWWAWWPSIAAMRSAAPDASGTGASTNASGVFSVTAPSSLSAGDNQGFGIISDQDATPDATEAAYVGSFDVV